MGPEGVGVPSGAVPHRPKSTPLAIWRTRLNTRAA